ncbi:hypothetical protein R1flu_000927 [Riccia fluitans]|uniref:Uncharacterized protein n=1 Tax=Riccia fluitans TaxID=41844 RepID=A0ABD1Y4S3_9MARC
MQVREAELLECSILRRSRVEWAEKGESCSRYFFATLKAKQTKERMSILCDEEDREVRDKELILEQVYNYYTELYIPNQQFLLQKSVSRKKRLLWSTNSFWKK